MKRGITRWGPLLAVLVAAAGAGLPARAETAAECAAFLDMLDLTAMAAEPLGGGCLAKGIVTPLDGASMMTVKVDEAEFETEPALPALGSLREGTGQLPTKARLVLRRARMQMTTGNAVIDYTTNFRAVPFEIVVAYATDPKSGDLIVEELSARSELGLVRLSGTVAGIPAAFFANPDPALLFSAKLRRVDFDLDNMGLVENLVVPVVANAVIDPESTDAFADVEALKRRAIDGLSGTLDRAQVQASARDALAAFVAELPLPKKRLTISADFPKPLTIGDAMLIVAGAMPDERLRELSDITASYR